MNQVNEIFRKFTKNKNLITILGIILILILLYVGYSYQINSAVEPVQVPVAKETIQPRSEITEDMITTVDMPATAISDYDIITNSQQVVGKYSNVNTMIPAGSMFYTDSVIEKDELPDIAFIKVKKGQVAYSFPVTIDSTYGNSIYPGNFIDIYMEVDIDEKVMVGRLVENVEVLAVKDSSGQNVFENTSEARTPAYLMFGLKEEVYLLLQKAAYLDVDLFPVIHGGKYTEGGTTEVSTQQLVDYIEANAVNIPVADNNKTSSDNLVPTIEQSNEVPGLVTITFPEGCGSDYTCTYKKDNGKSVKVTETIRQVTFTKNGTISATVKEKDGTTHKTNKITIDTQASATTNDQTPTPEQ